MINNKSVLAVIPVRGGSKGILKKNIRQVSGKPLFIWTVDEARKSKFIDRIIVSTDDYEILDIAHQYDCDAPFRRPSELATDKAETIDVVLHALSAVTEPYHYVVLLQATSPLRKVYDIDQCILKCEQRNVTSVASVSEVEKSPYWMYSIDKDDRMNPILETNNRPMRRQDVRKIYQLNGAVYVNKVDHLKIEKRFVTGSTLAHIMPAVSSIDIDTEFDFIMLKHLMKAPD